jgi:hypothetical protein
MNKITGDDTENGVEYVRADEAQAEIERLNYEVDAIPAIKEERDSLASEVLEQCRIIAMGAEREDALRAELTRLKASIALDKKAENAREIGLSYAQQPTVKQSLQVAPSIVDAYCAAWEQSFLADNPFDTVHLTDALKKHVEAGLKAALAKAIGETK